ncbi:MAG: DUF4032 domain-containing protein [Chloroflexi bacterium]|nr:MAG: DUF4032 domain-containing protein [Chloroflexota bacterium]
METTKTHSSTAPVKFQMDVHNRRLLQDLPWNALLQEWPAHGVVPLMVEREIASLREIDRRGIPALDPIGSVIVPAPPVLLEEKGPNGLPVYTSGDRGYMVTQLAPRVIPHSLLYRIPFTRKTKRRILSAIAILLIELHEHGVYWGDPSLANVLIRIAGQRIQAILADAETAEFFPGPVNEGLREQDLESFGESLMWQAEDLRYALGLPEDEELLDDKDFRYLEQRYRILRREHRQLHSSFASETRFQFQHMLESLNERGFSLLGMGGQAFQQFATVLPGWYQRRIHELLGIHVPRRYARRFYNTILGHQYHLSQNEGRNVSLEKAAKDWYTHYHLPAILFLRQHLTKGQDPLQAYFSFLEYRWKLSMKAGYEVPLEEAALSWLIQQVETEKLTGVDPADLARWWHERVPVAQVLEPPLIEGKELEPLLSKEEQPLVHLPAPELDKKLDQILEHSEEE